MGVGDLIQVFINMFVLSNALMLGVLFLIVKSENKKANIFLGLFLLSISIQIFNDFIGELPIEEELGISLFIVEPFLFALPILFFYLLTPSTKGLRTGITCSLFQASFIICFYILMAFYCWKMG